MKRNRQASTAATPASPRKPRRRGARPALWVIVAALAASGLLRFGGGSGQAIASNLAGAVDAAVAAPPAACETEADIALVLEALRVREGQLAEREEALEVRMQALSVAETRFEANRTALIEAEDALKATMALASGAAETDLARLTSVYENMKPKDAAPLFAAMDPQFAAGFLGRMRPDAVAAIMAGLEPDMAYAISVLLAGRNAEAPTE